MKLEAVFHRFRSRVDAGKAVPEVVLPEINPLAKKIDLTSKHPLYFYPGFQEFADAWNGYVDSEERRALVEATHKAPEVDLTENIVDALRTRHAESNMFLSSPGEKSKEEIKRARRTRRRSREQLERLGKDDELRKEHVDPVKTLKDHDVGFVVSQGNERAAVFYAAEFLRGGEEGEIDNLFQRAAATRMHTEIGIGFGLNSLNYSFLSIAKYFNREVTSLEEGADELWAKAEIATERQLKNMNLPPLRYKRHKP